MITELIVLTAEGLCTLTSISPFPTPSSPESHHSTLFLWVWHFFSIFISFYFILDSTCKWDNTVLSFSVWFIWLIKMSSRFIYWYVATNSTFPPFRGWIIFHHVFMSHRLLPMEVHVGCVRILATVSSASMNTGVQMSLWDTDFVSFGYICRSRIAGSHGSSIFNFLRKLYDVFVVATPTYLPTSSPQVFPFLHICISTYLVFLINTISTSVRLVPS